MSRVDPVPGSSTMHALTNSVFSAPGRGLWIASVSMFTADLLTILSSAVCGFALRQALGGDMIPSIYWGLAPLTVTFLAMFAFLGTYPGFGLGPVEELRRLTLGTSLVFLVLAGASFFFKTGMEFSRGVYLLAWAFALVLVPLGRAAVRRLLGSKPFWGEPVVILGAGKTGRMVADVLLRSPGLGLKPVALLDDDHLKHGVHAYVPVLGGLEVAATGVGWQRVQHAIVAMPGVSRAKLIHVLRHYLKGFRTITIIPELFGLPSLWVSPRDLDGMLGLEIRNQLLVPSARRLKRTIDLFAGTLLLLCLAPMLGVIALAIKLDSRGPILYRHQRIGGGGRSFGVIKFRTMVQDADRVLAQYLEERQELRDEWERYQKLKNDPRITRVGKILRRLSLDELPQLFNVLRGEMSLVGPRPIVADEARHYRDVLDLYTAVSPGMTGLWQVSGRNNVSYDERVRLDAYYVRNWSVWLDLYVLARTVPAVLGRKGAY